MFEKLFPKFSLINQAKPLKSLKFINLSASPHNPKVDSSSMPNGTGYFGINNGFRYSVRLIVIN
jgi:hypothetical protein